MTARVAVLGSGSSGNATLLQVAGRGLLIDCGFSPRDLLIRFQSIGLSWSNVNAVLLTHTHGDHWNRYVLEQIRRLKIPLIAHPKHHVALSHCDEYVQLMKAGLAHNYTSAPFTLGGLLRVQPIEVHHDSEPTFAFRIGQTLPDCQTWSYGHASDLGCVSDALRNAFQGVDVLALEFNHDVQLERASKRPRHLVQRVLSDYGHLSNDQAAGALKEWVDAGEPGELQSVIALHLSRDCNRPELAIAAAAAAAPQSNIYVATQTQATPMITIMPHEPRMKNHRPPAQKQSVQGTLLDQIG